MESEESKKITTIEQKSKASGDVTPKILLRKGFWQLWTSRKLWMTLIAFALNWFAYWREVRYLHSFTDPNQITAFAGLTRDFYWGVALALSAYLGVQGAVEWKHGTTTTLNEAASFTQALSDSKSFSDTKSESTTTNTNINKNITEQGQPGAPEVKPFSQTAQ